MTAHQPLAIDRAKDRQLAVRALALFREGRDTLDIADALKLSEHEVCRLLDEARAGEARQQGGR